MTISKKRYLQGFCIVVIVLSIVRCAMENGHQKGGGDFAVSDSLSVEVDSLAAPNDADNSLNDNNNGIDGEKNDVGTQAPHKILGVTSYKEAFPDTNDLQLEAARRWGVKPVQSREEAEHCMTDLVYVGSNPYYFIEPLKRSIPYLVPRAASLLQTIGQSFFDSLQVKGVPLHKIVVTSVMRTKDDVKRLRGHNRNATENSCHLYGTTFDICYNRYLTVQAPGEHRREVRNDTLKFILSEVLDDLRQQGRCYVKYEVKQSCFHITTR